MTVRRVKTSLRGLERGARLLEKAGLIAVSGEVKFHDVGYGCTNWHGQLRPLPEKLRSIETTIWCCFRARGNRNLKVESTQRSRQTNVCSRLCVVAFALAGRIDVT